MAYRDRNYMAAQQRNAERMTKVDQTKRILALEQQVVDLCRERNELRSEVATLTRPDPREAAVQEKLADPEWLELHRIEAWADQPGWQDYWDSKTRSLVFPDEGWPEGTSAESWIRERTGLGASAQPNDDTPPTRTTFMHAELARRMAQDGG